jgi:6-phosphogluconolactonase
LSSLIHRLLVVLLACLWVPIALAKTFILYAGSYTVGSSKGIYAWKFDSANGSLSPLGLMAETAQPAHLWISASGRFLYAVDWEKEGAVSAFGIDENDAHLTLLNRVSSHGELPNQIVLDPSGRLAATVNYATGTLAVYRVTPDGGLSEAVYVDQHEGTPLSANQPGPRAHGVEFSKDSRLMYVTDLGLDRIYVYEVDASKAAITPAQPPFVSTHAGAGPRRLQLARDDRFLYVNHETDSEVSVFAVRRGALTEIQRISTLPPGTTTRNTTAEILIDAKGRHLYVSNRGDDSIAVFTIAPASGKLTLEANVPSGGRTPRNIRLDPTGHYLLCANENSGTITVLRVDGASGLLTATNVVAQIDTPGGLYFRPTASAGQTLWHFDNLQRIGGFKVDVEGQPRVIHTPVGAAIQFDGRSDSLLIDGRPLVGASTFTIEVLFRPDGGAFEQRFMHIAETDPHTGLDAPAAGTEDLNERIMFEVRVVGGEWYLDAFVKSQAGGKTLASSKSLHPLGRWYAVAQTYDGKTYRAYVDGKLESEADVSFVPHGPGRVRVGARMNRVSYFHGAIAEAWFDDRVLTPEQFLKASN